MGLTGLPKPTHGNSASLFGKDSGFGCFDPQGKGKLEREGEVVQALRQRRSDSSYRILTNSKDPKEPPGSQKTFSYPEGPKGPNVEYVGLLILGIVILVFGTYLLFGSLDP